MRGREPFYLDPGRDAHTVAVADRHGAQWPRHRYRARRAVKHRAYRRRLAYDALMARKRAMLRERALLAWGKS